jgi:hypothetical protein
MPRTEVLDGGVDGVAATEKEADEPGADEAAAARHADEAAAAAAVSVRCHRDRRQGSSGRCAVCPPLYSGKAEIDKHILSSE